MSRDIFDQNFLFTAETAANSGFDHPNPFYGQA
jgi:hypothetical protein